MKVYVSWASPDFVRELQQRLQADEPEELRRQQQRLDSADALWRSWCMANDGSVLECGRGEGVLEIPAAYLSELPNMQQQYGTAINSTINVGVGTKIHESKKALEVSGMHGGDIVLYSLEVEHELQEAHEDKDPIKDILNKALPGQSGFGGFSRSRTAVAPASPVAEASEHSQAEGARMVAADASEGAPPPPEATDAAGSMEDHFHQVAGQQDQQDQDDADHNDKEIAATKAAVASALQRIKASAASIGMLKQADPHAYAAIQGMVTSVIAMAHTLVNKDPMKKSEESLLKMALANIPVGEHKDSYTAPNGMTTKKFDYDHTLPEPLRGKYTCTVQTKATNNGYHGITAAIHHGDEAVGNVDGYIMDDGTLGVEMSTLKGEHRGKGLGQSMYEAVMAHAKNAHGAHTIKGDDHSTSSHRVHQKLAEKHGLDYDHLHDDGDGVEEDFDGAFGDYEYALKQELPMEKGGLPMPHAGKRKVLNLPVGSVKTGGPTGNSHGEVGKVKVAHGDGKTSWIQARAGQVTAVADRHAKPILGHASHPLSSRNPSGH